MIKKKRALVIGATGQLGNSLLQILEREGFEVTGTFFTRKVPGLLQLDVRNKDSVEESFRSLKPQIVFLATIPKGGADFCETHPQEARAILLEGTKNVAETALSYGSQMVFYSSDYIFDGKAGPYGEEDPPNPINVYGKLKWEAEQLLQKLFQILNVLSDLLLIRTTALFSWERSSPNFAMQLWEQLQSKKAMPAAQDEWCNPTLASYLAEASVRLIQMNAQGIYNIVGRDRMTRYDLAVALARALSLDGSLVIPKTSMSGEKNRAPRPLQAGLKINKIKEILSTEPPDIEESMHRFRKQFLSDMRLGSRAHRIIPEAEKIREEIVEKVRLYSHLVHQTQPFVPFKSKIHYAGRVFNEEEVVSLVNSSLDFWLTLGNYGELFEKKMKEFFGSKGFVFVNSGSTANLTAILTLLSQQIENPLQPGDEVITPAVTFPTTLTPIVHSGLVPVFVDCEVGTYNINPLLIEESISDKTRAIVIPHTLGNPCDMELICEIAKRHHLYLMEDTCDALGSTFRDKLAGTFGDLATLSFFPAHHITVGEGGGVIINNPALLRSARAVRDWGRDCWCATGESNTCGKRFGWKLGELPYGYDHKYIYTTWGYNFKPTDMQAAIGVVQAERIGEFCEKRRRNFALLYKGLEPLQEFLLLPKLDPRSNPAWFGFPITVQKGISRADLVQWLEMANIETRMIFGGNILKQPAYQNINKRVAGELHETERIMQDTFFIGVYPGINEEMIGFILERVHEFFERKRRS